MIDIRTVLCWGWYYLDRESYAVCFNFIDINERNWHLYVSWWTAACIYLSLRPSNTLWKLFYMQSCYRPVERNKSKLNKILCWYQFILRKHCGLCYRSDNLVSPIWHRSCTTVNIWNNFGANYKLYEIYRNEYANFSINIVWCPNMLCCMYASSLLWN